MKLRITAAVVAGVATLAIAACGDDEETTATTTPTTTETGATGATGAEDEAAGGEAVEGEAAVNDLLTQAFVAQGLTEGEAQCVSDLVAPEVANEDVTDLQDPAYIEDLLSGVESEIQECEGQ